MADLTAGEVGVALRVTLVTVDTTQNPPVQSPLNLSGASSVKLMWVITNANLPPQPIAKTVDMSIIDATNGIVEYVFVAGDLAIPPGVGKFGVFRYTIQANLSGGTVIFQAADGQLTIKDDSVL